MNRLIRPNEEKKLIFERKAHSTMRFLDRRSLKPDTTWTPEKLCTSNSKTPQSRVGKLRDHMMVVENPFEDRLLFTNTPWSGNGWGRCDDRVQSCGCVKKKIQAFIISKHPLSSANTRNVETSLMN